MKKLVLLLLIAVFISPLAVAQGEEQEEVYEPNNRIGIKGGLNFAKIDSDLGANTVRRRGYHAGIYFQYNISEKFAIQPELQWSSEGWIKEGVDMSAGDDEIELHYINLTTVARAYIVGGLNVEAGVMNGFLIKANGDYKTTTPGPSKDINSNIKNYNLGAIFGIGYEFGFGLQLGGRYVQGLININKIDNGINTGSIWNDEIKTTNFQLFIGYSIGLPKGRNTYEAM